MLKDQCISITDLRVHTKKCMTGLKKSPKYIFINNKPRAVIVDLDEYEKITGFDDGLPKFIEMTEDQLTSKLKKSIEDAKKIDKSKLLNI